MKIETQFYLYISFIVGIGFIVGIFFSIYLIKKLPSRNTSKYSKVICAIFLFIFFFLPFISLSDFLTGFLYISTPLTKKQIKPFQNISKYFYKIFDWILAIYTVLFFFHKKIYIERIL